MRTILFFAADIWMITIGFIYGVKFIRRHHNYLLGLEWIIMGVSGTNFLIYAITKASVSYHILWFLDAFSRSIGFTLIVVLGLLVVTHGYRPSIRVEVGAFALAAVFGFVLSVFAEQIGIPGKVFMMTTCLATCGFLLYFARRLWAIGQRTHAAWVVGDTAVVVYVIAVFDFFGGIPGDDADRTLFWTLALSSWGLMMLILYRAYTAFAAHNIRVGAGVDRATASTV